MPRTRWFPGRRLSWAEQHVLRRGADDATALVTVRKGGGPAHETTYPDLRRRVGALPIWLREAGVRPDETVAAYLPNTENAVVGVLAAAAVAAVGVLLAGREASRRPRLC